MRYNPATDKATSIDEIAAQCRQAILERKAERRPRIMAPSDVFASDLCRTWILCIQAAMLNNDRGTVALLEGYLDRDMHLAMHHRPHQPEY